MAPLMAAGGQRQPSSLVAHATGALYGVVSLLLLLPVTLGYASLMLGSVGLDNPQLLSRVASLMFLANGTFALTYAALDRGTHASIGSVQDPGVMFLAAVVQSLASACATAPECSTEVSSTAIIMIAGGATAITALAFLLLSFMPRLVQLVTYIPLPVVGGFLASIGAFILQGGLSLSLEPVDLPKGAMDSAGAASGWVAAAYSLVAEENRLPAVLSLGYGVALSIVVRISSHPAVLPCAMALPVPIFYAVVAMSPLSFDEPWSENMFFSDSTLSDGTPNNTTVEDVGIFPPLVVGVAQNKLPIAQAAALIASSSGLPGLLANMVAAVCVSTLLLNTLGVETSLGLSFDYREELRLLASSNMISALAGGVPGARNYTLTVLTHTGLSAVGNTKSRAGAVTCGLLFVAMYLLDLPLHTGVPRWAFSGVLLFVGVDLLLAWLFTARSSMGRSDFGVVWLSFLAIQLLGINAGMAISVLVSIVAFIVQYSRVAVISRAPVRRANRFRLASERSALIKADAAILRYRVAGVLFFATARQLLAVIGAELDRIEAAVAAQAEARALAGGDTQPKGLRKRRLRGGARSARVSAETDGGAAADANSGSPSSVAGSAVVPAKFVLLDCGELQGIDASATQTFLRLRRMLNARGCVLVMCALPGQVWQLLRREGVLPDDSAVDSEEPLAVALRDYDAAAEWCEDRLLLSLGVGSTARPTDSHTSQASSSIVSSSHVTPGLPGDDESKAIEGADGESAQLSDLQPCPEVVESFSVRAALSHSLRLLLN